MDSYREKLNNIAQKIRFLSEHKGSSYFVSGIALCAMLSDSGTKATTGGLKSSKLFSSAKTPSVWTVKTW